MVAILAQTTFRNSLNHSQFALFTLGIASIACAMYLCVLAIRPRLKSHRTSSQIEGHFIFFGHLTAQTRAEIRGHLLSSDILIPLVNQLKEMSDICWRKHKRVQWSINLFVVGLVLIGIPCLIFMLADHFTDAKKP
ncbi:Pycsar system effector family protein [Gordonia lacunae]|uniref:Pycsar system effector family protein n=1 Tax=Gordonia lacunae TaxID=417102 RepID=UPI003CC63157